MAAVRPGGWQRRGTGAAFAGGGLNSCFDRVSAALLLLDCPSRTAPEPEPPHCACWPQSTEPLPCLVIWGTLKKNKDFPTGMPRGFPCKGTGGVALPYAVTWI